MNLPRPTPAAVAPRMVLICAGCSYAWEPASGAGTEEHLQAVDVGCTQCGDWLFLGELIDPAIPTTRRHGQ